MDRRKKQEAYRRRAQSREKGAKGTDGRQAGHQTFSGERNGDNKGWDRFKQAQLNNIPEALPKSPHKRHINVFVEGYDDVSFWRGILDRYESDSRTFEINVPPREDLAKGKKVVISMVEDSSPSKLLCVDSDFDYLFGERTDQSKLVNNSKFIFHTYAYSTENFLCYAPSLHNLCVKITKNDTRIFDFEEFMAEYSKIIYPIFLWYALSGQQEGTEKIFTLLNFKSTVKLNYLEVDNNGRATLGWLSRQTKKRLRTLERDNPGWGQAIAKFEKHMISRGLTPESTYLFMQGHTLMDNVVIVMLNAVCEKLRLMSNIRISTSTKTGMALKNEMSNYNNALQSVRDVLINNELYKDCYLYAKLQRDLDEYIDKLSAVAIFEHKK